MFTTEKEIRAQFDALRRTIEYINGRKEEIQNAFDETRSLCIVGCGSSFSLAKSAAKQFTQLSQIPAHAIAAGDLLVNFGDYVNFISNSTILILSRSGSTSEVLKATALCKNAFQSKIVSVCAREGSPLEGIADINLLLPWSFDESVCQTRTVSNLYIVGFMIAAIIAGNKAAFDSTRNLGDGAETFCTGAEPALRQIAESGWTKAVVLADSAVEGIAEEGALAFQEICRRDSNYYHVLDARHGPMVQIHQDTLVITMVSSGDFQLQADLIADISKKTNHVLALSRSARVLQLKGCVAIQLPDCGSDAVSAVYALYCIQIICFLHALYTGVNPDAPEGLDAWINLK